MSKRTTKVIQLTSKSRGAGNLVDLPPTDPMPTLDGRMDSDRADGWQNLITSLGTNNDKRSASKVTWDHHSPEEWEQRYAADFMSRRIVNLVVEDALRKWVEWQGVEKNIAKEIEKRAKQLDLRGCMERTWKWGRAYGGACTYIVTDTNDPASPLQVGERVIGLRDLSRYDLRILTTDVETDFGSPNWGYPRIYYLVVQVGSVFKGYPIHWTRMVRFDGALVPRRTFIRNNYWHDSVLNSVSEPIRDYQTSYGSTGAILQDFNVGKYKLKNLANMMSAGKEAKVKDRIEMMNYSKSVIRAMVLDSDDEDFEDMSRSVEGLAELLTKMDNRLVAATDIPHTKLLGESPDGSNATGNSTTNQWFDHVQSEQENYLRPRMKRLTDAIFFDIPDLDWKFKPLYQKTELEDADIRLKTAQADDIYLTHEVIDPTEIAESRFGGDSYSIETKLDQEGRELGLIGPGMHGIEGEGNEEDGGGDEGSGGNNAPFGGDDGAKGSKRGDLDLHAGDLTPKGDQGRTMPPASSGASLSEQPRQAKREALAKGTQTEAESEEGGLPQSLRPYTPSPGGVETQNNGTAFNSRNETIVAPEKASQLITQTMSEPFRDPKTDPKLRSGGKPNNPRTIAPTRGNGVIAPSGGQYRADSGESAIMPRGLDYAKPGFIEPPLERGDEDETAAQVAVIAVMSANRLLMGQRRDTGLWTLPGGHIEPGESSIDGALRELEEETGIVARASELNLVGSKMIEDSGARKQIHIFMIQTAQKPTTGKSDPDAEVERWRWVDVKGGKLSKAMAENLQHNPNVALEALGIA